MTESAQFIAANDHFAAHCGIETIEAAPGHARVRLVISPEHFNAAGTVHGGAIFTLADYAFALAANSGGTLALAVDTHLTFIKAVTGGVLEAEATEIACNRKLGTYQVRISQDDTTVALFQGTAYRKEGARPMDGFQGKKE